jgi:hypothetical protein
LFPMKIKDITEWSERWSTPLGTGTLREVMDAEIESRM